MKPRERFIEAVKAADIKKDDWHYDIIQAIPDSSTCTRILCEWNRLTEGEDPHDEYMQEWLEEQADEIDEDILATSLIEWRSPDNPPEKLKEVMLFIECGMKFIVQGCYAGNQWSAKAYRYNTEHVKAWAYIPEPPKL